MKEYRTNAIIRIATGEIRLTGAQAKPRKHNLQPVKVNEAGDGVYQILAPVEFKAGEVIGLVKPDKTILMRVDDLTPPKEKEKPEAEPKAAAKPKPKPKAKPKAKPKPQPKK